MGDLLIAGHVRDAPFLLAGYVPSFWLGVVGAALFGLLACIFFVRACAQGKGYMTVLIIGTIAMGLGLGCRIPLHEHPYNVGIFIGMTLLTLCSPCFFLAQDYVILPRLAKFLDAQDCLFLPSRVIVHLFVWSDVITFWLQLIGSIVSSSDNPKTQHRGHTLALGGLAFQLVSFALFTMMAIVFGIRVKRKYEERWGTPTKRWYHLPKDWRRLYYALLWTSIGFLIRSGYRTAEFIKGGKLSSNEKLFYLLDSLPLFLAISVWVLVWPPKYMRADEAWSSADIGRQDSMAIPLNKLRSHSYHEAAY